MLGVKQGRVSGSRYTIINKILHNSSSSAESLDREINTMENAEKDREVDDLFKAGLQVLLEVSFEERNLKIDGQEESEGQTDGLDRQPVRHRQKDTEIDKYNQTYRETDR